MVTFDSPIERCPVCQEYVLMDQTQKECAREHQCNMEEKCPLKSYFEGDKYRMGQYGRAIKRT
jgi:hypothetical protein